jgi:hypothetical protein
LAHRRGIPGISMRVEGVGDARGQKMRRVSRAQPGNVEVQFPEINPVLPHNLLYYLLAIGMMDELRLQLAKYRFGVPPTLVVGHDDAIPQLEALVAGDSVAIQGSLEIESKAGRLTGIFVVALAAALSVTNSG